MKSRVRLLFVTDWPMYIAPTGADSFDGTVVGAVEVMVELATVLVVERTVVLAEVVSVFEGMVVVGIVVVLIVVVFAEVDGADVEVEVEIEVVDVEVVVDGLSKSSTEFEDAEML